MYEHISDTLLGFIKQRVPVVLTLAGIGFVLVSICEVDDIMRLKVKPRENTVALMFAVGVLFCIAGVFTYYYRDKIEILSDIDIPTVRGSWTYRVISIDKEYYHEGEMVVEQTGRQVVIYGTRLKQWRNGTDPAKSSSISVLWRTIWGEVCEDRRLRFHYYITMNKTDIVFAFCDVPIGTDKRPSSLVGEYFLLPPHANAIDTTRHRTIVFTKTDKLSSSAEIVLPLRTLTPTSHLFPKPA